MFSAPMQSFYSRFLTSAESYPSQIAAELQLAHPSTEVVSYTYAELRGMAESVGHWLRNNNIQPGDRCAILAANGPRWVIAYFGAISIGAVAVPLDTAFKADQVAKLLLDCGGSLVFTDEKHLDIVREAIAQMSASNNARTAMPRIVLLTPSPADPSLPALDAMFANPPASLEPHASAPD